ncbi:MAG TPA: hypothetical protein VNJ01_02235 [Bacteriovoracaceae bacterium]|nr:hypothetical protein [Bacteriovoracaceae bacterium]
MKVYLSPYRLTPLKRANHSSSLAPKSGVLLKAVLKDATLFADYFPHENLGDRGVEEFLQDFKYQKVEYDQKVLDLLLRDGTFQKLKAKSFLNHKLWDGSPDPAASVVKYKVMDPQDVGFLPLLQRGVRIRLDCNGLFSKASFKEFQTCIPEKSWPLIEYVEDPIRELDWGEIPFPTARDFIQGQGSSYTIYKPNCEFLPVTDSKIIFSSYLGSDFGRWHSYCELALTGNLELFHGIITTNFFTQERPVFHGNYLMGFSPNAPEVRKLYSSLSAQPWKHLCSI